MPFEQTAYARTAIPSPTLAINERVQRLQADGKTVYHLGFGESRFPVHPKILAAFRDAAGETVYPPVAGFPETRETIAGFYSREFGIDARPDRIVVGPGSKSLIYALLHVLAGDLLLHRPAWVSYEPFARMLGKQTIWLDTRAEDEYCLMPETLEAGIVDARRAGADPRILLINSPGNPTGVTYPETLVAEVAAVARAHDLTVISDEIYALQAYPERPHVSIARYYPEGTAVTGGLSKHLSLGGWRFGCTVLPATDAGGAIMQPLVSVAGNIWSSPAAPVQRAATVAYSDDADIRTYVQTCTDIHRIVTQHVHAELRAAGIACPPPSGAYYLYPCFDAWAEPLRERHDVTTSEELAALLLDELGIATLPGTAFGSRPHNLVLRLATSYLYEPDRPAVHTTLRAHTQADTEEAFVRSTCPAVYDVGHRLQTFVDGLNSSG